MPLSHEKVGFKIAAKIQIYIPTRAELLITLCYEIPCRCQKISFKYYLLYKIQLNCWYVLVKIWQFKPSRLESLKTHHCGLVIPMNSTHSKLGINQVWSRVTSVTMLSSNKVLYIFVVILFGILYLGVEVDETNQKPRSLVFFVNEFIKTVAVF